MKLYSLVRDSEIFSFSRHLLCTIMSHSIVLCLVFVAQQRQPFRSLIRPLAINRLSCCPFPKTEILKDRWPITLFHHSRSILTPAPAAEERGIGRWVVPACFKYNFLRYFHLFVLRIGGHDIDDPIFLVLVLLLLLLLLAQQSGIYHARHAPQAAVIVTRSIHIVNIVTAFFSGP